jgi:dolichol kinase
MINFNEILRKLTHLGSTAIPLVYYYFNISKYNMIILLAFTTVFVVVIDLTRNRIPWIKEIFEKILNGMLRKHELNGKLTGASWVIIGAFITIAIFPPAIAILALLYMTLGDTAAALIGMQFGRKKIWGKTLEGTLAGLAVCLIVGWFFKDVSWMVSIGGAITAMLVELMPIKIDDNVRVPVAAGLIMVILSGLGL